jgi:hypothetical protein
VRPLFAARGSAIRVAHRFTHLEHPTGIINRDSESAPQTCPDEGDGDIRPNEPDASHSGVVLAALVDGVKELPVIYLDDGASLMVVPEDVQEDGLLRERRGKARTVALVSGGLQQLCKLMIDSPSQQSEQGLRLSAPDLAHPMPTDPCQMPPDLPLIVERWDTLPEAVRAGIVAMVKASGKGDGR